MSFLTENLLQPVFDKTNATSIRHETNPVTDICNICPYEQLRCPIQ